MSYATRQAKRGHEVEIGISPVKVALFITATIAYFVHAEDGEVAFWWAIGVGLGLSVGIGWGLSVLLFRRLDAEDDDFEYEDDDEEGEG